MSKAPAKAEAAEGEEAPKKSKKMLVIILVVVLLLVAGGGAAFFLLKKKQHKEGEEGGEDGHEKVEEHAKEPPKVHFDPTKPPIFIPVDPFTVNLQAENGADHYLQVNMVLRISDAKLGETLKLYMPELRHRVNLILSSKRPSDLTNIEGREQLAEEVKIEANDILGYPPPKKKRRRPEDDGPIIAVLFNSLIIQ